MFSSFSNGNFSWLLNNNFETNPNFTTRIYNNEDLDNGSSLFDLFQPNSITDVNNSNFQNSDDYNGPLLLNNINLSNQETAPRTSTIQRFNFIRKKRGRKRANSAHRNEDDKNVHTKYSDDNIRKVLVRKLYDHTETYDNILLKESQNPNLKSLELLKVKSSVINVHKKEDFLALLDTKTKDIFSNEVSKKYLESKKDNNKIAISIILEQNDETLNYSLNLTFEDMLHIYVSKNRNAIFKDFPYIEQDMEIMKAKGHDDNYVNKYRFYAEHFREKIEEIDGRERRRREENEV